MSKISASSRIGAPSKATVPSYEISTKLWSLVRGRASRALPSWRARRWWASAVDLDREVVHLVVHFAEPHGDLRAHVVEMHLNLFAALLQDVRHLCEGHLGLGGACGHLREDLRVLGDALLELENLLATASKPDLIV